MGLFARRSHESMEDQERRSWSLAQLGQGPWVETASPTTIVLSRERAIRDAAAWACIDVLAGSVSETPVDVVRYVGASRVPVTPTPSLISAPSGVVTVDVWLYQLVTSLLTDGNGFGHIADDDPYGRPTQIELVDPCTVTDRQVIDGIPTVRIGGKQRQVWPHGDVWHCPGKFVLAGSPFALSPLTQASGSIDTSLSAQRYGWQYFTGGGHPTAILYSDTELDETQAKQIKAAFRRATTGTREPAVMGAGIRYEKVQTSPSDALTIDTMRFQVEQVCRFFRVPPSMVYGAVTGQNVTYANVSQADLAYLKHSLDGYLVRIERALTALLARPHVVRFNRKAILRSDPKGRYEVHKMRLETKTATVNEVRADEDEPPFDDPIYDQPGIPGNSNPAQPPSQEGDDDDGSDDSAT